MYEQDYILRLARQLAAVVTRVLGLRDSGAVEEAVVEIERAYGELFGLPTGLVDAMAPDDLLRLLADPQKIALMAELMETDGRVLEGAERVDAAARRRRTAAALRRYLADAARK
jgi:adenylate kinase